MSTNNGTKLQHSNHNGIRSRQLPSVIMESDREESAETNRVRVATRSERSMREFEQSVILQQSPIWSRAILWVLMGVTAFSIIWACVAKIEEAIPAQGKLEPTGTVKEVQAPVGGVVKAVHVTDGQQVQQGQRLVSLDSTASVAQLASLLKIRTSLNQENQFYQTQMRNSSDTIATEQTIAQLRLPPQLTSLVESRATLVAENQLYRAQLDGRSPASYLDQQQVERLQSTQAELDSRVATSQAEVEQLVRQLNQTQIRLASARETLNIHQGILQNFEPLAKQGAMSRIQYLEQKQKAQISKSEVDQLSQEWERLQTEISGARSKTQNTIALSRKEWLTQIADNGKRIAEIDSQLTKAIVENNKRLAEVESEISQAQLSMRYTEITAPANGTVFDLQARTPGFVANTSQPILKIVPNDTLTAKVFITNKDIGFVKEGMDVDVRIDSFPFSEFGDVKGKLVSIGSDALPPDEIHPFFRFPAKVQLERQSLTINGRKVPLQSGMSVGANIRVRERSVMSIFTDLFTKSIESLRTVR